MKKVLLVGILALLVVGCVFAAGCTYDDDETAAQLAMGNLGAFSLGSGTLLTDEQLALLGDSLPGMIAGVNQASGNMMTDADLLELQENILHELGKASSASGYMTEDYLVDSSMRGHIWIDFLKEANRASGTLLTDEQLGALGTAIEEKLGETIPASGSLYYDVDYDYAAKDSPTPAVVIPGKRIFGASQASGTVLGEDCDVPTSTTYEYLYPFGREIIRS